MKILCFCPVRNENDILPYTLRAMRREGIEVYVLDGWSTDGSWGSAIELAAGHERWPAVEDGVWSCERTLLRIEELAAASDADWCMLSDADEIRVSDRHERLADRIALASHQGYNVIDYRVLSFQPIDESYAGDPEQHFRYYTEDPEIDGVCRPQQEKTWKNDCRVDIHTSGGHVIYRADKRVYPQRLLMKHYPFRTTAQARQKMADRLGRRDHREHRDYGWGSHYDKIAADAVFVRDPKTLKEWK